MVPSAPGSATDAAAAAETAYYGWVFDPQHPETNASGFMGPEVARARTPGVRRSARLGGWTTAGNLYEGYANSYAGNLAAVPGERLGEPVEVLNFGVAGWTTAESLVSWRLNVQDYHPGLVLIHHAINDVYPRLASGFRSDYTRYTHPWRATPFPAWRAFLTRWSDLFAAAQLGGRDFDLAEHLSVPSTQLPVELAPETSVAFQRNQKGLPRNVRWSGATPVLMSMPWREPVRDDALEHARWRACRSTPRARAPSRATRAARSTTSPAPRTPRCAAASSLWCTSLRQGTGARPSSWQSS